MRRAKSAVNQMVRPRDKGLDGGPLLAKCPFP